MIWRCDVDRLCDFSISDLMTVACIYTTDSNVLVVFINMYRVRQKSRPLKFFAVFSTTVWNFNLKFYRFIY